jgi:hypothetical protein
MLRNIGIAVGLVGALAASGAFLVAQAAPEPQRGAAGAPSFAPQKAPAKTFDASCSANEQADSRPDPKWVGQSFADDACVAPVTPKVIDGYTASIGQIKAGLAAQKKYAAQADAYQQCIIKFVTARRTQAEQQKKTLAMAFVVIENHRIAASEANKKKTAEQIGISVRQYNEAGSEDCK